MQGSPHDCAPSRHQIGPGNICADRVPSLRDDERIIRCLAVALGGAGRGPNRHAAGETPDCDIVAAMAC